MAKFKRITYTEQDIVDVICFQGLKKVTRLRRIADRRFYLYFVLYHTFGWTYQRIADAFEHAEHSSVMSGEKQVPELLKQELFVKNVGELIEKFPVDVKDAVKRKERSKIITVKLTAREKTLVEQHRINYRHTSTENALRDMIRKFKY